MSIFDLVLGKPIASSDERGEQISAAAGIPIFGLDALSSAAYGPEAALTLLLPLGLVGVGYIVPVSASIIALLAIVYVSYRQTIVAYPGGGGSYTVASENLGVFPGLLAAAALMLDYVLTAAVGISAGVGALVSAAPGLQPHTLSICLGILVAITLVNLRGVRETGGMFMIPTYLFVGTLLVTIAGGLAKTVLAGGHPAPVVAPVAPAPSATVVVGLWLLLQVFSNGCTAMTGVEAVSNGVRAFREPVVKHAQRTLTVIIGLLIVLLAGIAYLVRAYGITATEPGEPGYQSVLSILVLAVAGRGWFYYLTIGSVLAVLALSANTAFADFPRLCRAVAQDNFLPHALGFRGRRLVYTEGILVLAALAAALLIVFGGVTDRLIPLYAIGAFLAFTMSQTGMVAHWRRLRGRGAARNAFVNGLGAVATGGTLLVVLIAKFREGAWVSTLLITAMLWVMLRVRRHYDRVATETRSLTPLVMAKPEPLTVIVPIQGWGRIAENALQFAFRLSTDVTAVHVAVEDEDSHLQQDWNRLAEAPAMRAGIAPPKLVVLPSPYRLVALPICDYVLSVAAKNPERQLAVIVPELVERHWYHYPLHNKRAEILKWFILLKGNERIALVNVPWYLKS